MCPSGVVISSATLNALPAGGVLIERISLSANIISVIEF